jgi:hypothetical protein
MSSIVAITVSTNYQDLLSIVYEHNHAFFKHWYIVTDLKDKETIAFLSDKHDVTILYWDFQNNNYIFDKGGAIRYAQEQAYENYPDDWYLIIDSDICLPPVFKSFLQDTLPGMDTEAIYGLNSRLDFSSLEDFKSFKNYKLYNHSKLIVGYFQLYREKIYYGSSRNCSLCDCLFTSLFSKRVMMTLFHCAHLGSQSHWDGKRQIGSDFKQ